MSASARQLDQRTRLSSLGPAPRDGPSPCPTDICHASPTKNLANPIHQFNPIQSYESPFSTAISPIFGWFFHPPPTWPHLAVAVGPWRRCGRGDLHQETRQIRRFEGQLQAEQLEERAADGPEIAGHGVPGERMVI